jgi:hypothetical protein
MQMPQSSHSSPTIIYPASGIREAQYREYTAIVKSS